MTEAAGIIAAAKPGFTPKVGVILGSGLGPMADDVTDATVIDYRDLPGFPQPSVEGHAGRLSLGRIGRRRSASCRAAPTTTSMAGPMQ
jgi:purine nucleoside phosphorylase